MEYCSTVGRKELSIHETMALRDIMLSEKSQPEKST
jgi:hypothetical protein